MITYQNPGGNLVYHWKSEILEQYPVAKKGIDSKILFCGGNLGKQTLCHKNHPVSGCKRWGAPGQGIIEAY